MPKIKIRAIDIMYWVAIVAADFFVFLFLGVFLIGYEDSYDRSKGNLWSLASMDATEQFFYLLYIFWILLNIAGLIFIGRKVYKRVKYGA